MADSGSQNRLRVAVLCGGRSGEHEISLRSAEAVMAGLDPAKYAVEKIFISPEGAWTPRAIQPDPGANPGIDVVFPVLHGTFGEDGTVQGLLELAGLPYVGPGVLASSASMHKDVTKRLLSQSGLPVVEWETWQRGSALPDAMRARFAYPVFVKPANLGSSVGITKVGSPEQLPAAVELAAQYDRSLVIERGIQGREFECAVLGNEDAEAAIPSEIIPSREFYDYEDKYVLGTAQTIVPADIDDELTQRIRRLAVEAFHALECEGMARVDFLLEAATGKLYINEVNTIPGFTSISMYPKMWEAAGVGFGELLDRLIQLAMARHARGKLTRFAR